MATVSDVFSQLGLVQWWKYPTQYFGANGEEGTDFGMGGFKPVGSITTGKVVYVGNPYANDSNHSSLGYVVQVLTSDGKLFHYQHLKSPSVTVGQTVQVGTSVGISGGCPNGCYGANGQCTCTDAWTTGQHIEVREATYNPSGGVWGQPWANPLATFLAIAGGNASSAATTVVNTDTSGKSTSGGGAASSSGSSDWQSQFSREGEKIGIFLLAFVLVGFGFYLLFQKQANELAQTAVKAAKVAAL